MTPEKLAEYRENLVMQQRNALAAFHQASGAIALVDTLLAEEDEPEKSDGAAADLKLYERAKA